MAHVVKPLINWPKWHHLLYVRSSIIHLVQSPLPLFSTNNVRQPPLFTASPPAFRQAHFRSGAAFKSREYPLPLDPSESDSDSDVQTRKSRNEKKREARRAVRWAMDLAKFSAPQIKRILRVASVEQEVYDAVMLVKRLGPDVREGKRRQFNYIDVLSQWIYCFPRLLKDERVDMNSRRGKQSLSNSIENSFSTASHQSIVGHIYSEFSHVLLNL